MKPYWTIGRIIMLIIMCCGLLVLGTCYFQNCRQDSGPAAPSASNKIFVRVTANTYYSDNVTTRFFETYKTVTMNGYYEVVKGKYVYRAVILKLDSRNFGEIEVSLVK